MEPQSSGPKLYILVRADIPVPDQIVQVSHVTEMWTASMKLKRGDGPTVILSIPGKSIDIWQRKLTQKCLHWSFFSEPDLNNITTAIACLTDTNIFSGLELWTGKPKEETPY